MTTPESIPEDREESYPCECGEGAITFYKETGRWECDSCAFSLAAVVGIEEITK